MLSTKRKLAIARALNRAIVGARTIVGLSSRVTVRRHNVKWELDLNEGIDLAIYLGVYQHIPKRAVQWIPRGSLVIDVGANIGAHALPLAHDVDGHVVAIEPTDYGFSRLKANAALNPHLHPRLILVQAALTAGGRSADSKDSIQFYARWPLDGDGPDRHGKHLGKLETAKGARFLSLDTLVGEIRTKHGLEKPVAFIKLDVDGAELDVLRGATQILTSERPLVLIEIAPYQQDEISPERFSELLEILRGHRYSLQKSRSGQSLPMSASALRRLISNGAGIDVIAYHPLEHDPFILNHIRTSSPSLS